MDKNLLRIPYVPQRGHTTCWAACAAAIVDYHYQYDYSSLTILTMAAEHGIVVTGKNGANLTQAKKLLDLFGGVNRVRYRHLTFQELIEAIDDGCPLWMSSIIADGSSNTGHAVVAYGYRRGPDGGGTMYYMDPAGAMRMADFPKDGPVIYTNGGAMFRNNGFIVCRSGI